jgi:hypothetical protein
MHSNYTCYKEEYATINNFYMDILMILVASWIISIFIEGFEQYLRRPRNHNEDDDEFDMFDMFDIIDLF